MKFSDYLNEGAVFTDNKIKVNLGKPMKEAAKEWCEAMEIDYSSVVVRGDSKPLLLWIDAVIAFQRDDSWKNSKVLKNIVEKEENLKIKTFTKIWFQSTSEKIVKELGGVSVSFLDSENEEDFYYDGGPSDRKAIWKDFRNSFLSSKEPEVQKFVSQIVNGEYTPEEKPAAAPKQTLSKESFENMKTQKIVKETVEKALKSIKAVEVDGKNNSWSVEKAVFGKGRTNDYGNVYGFKANITILKKSVSIKIFSFSNSLVNVTPVDLDVQDTKELIKLINKAKSELTAGIKRYRTPAKTGVIDN